MKKLFKIPSTVPPPPPERVLSNLEWAKDDPDLMNYLKRHSRLVTFMDEDVVMTAGEMSTGIYVIISGIVRVAGIVEDNTVQEGLLSDPEYVQDIATRSSGLLMNMSEMRLALPQANQENVMPVIDYLGAGSILGEISLLTEKPRMATITCASAVEVGLLYGLYRGGSRIFEKGVHLSNNRKNKKGGPGGGPTLGPMLKSLHCGPRGGGGGPDPLDPPPRICPCL